jgi:hypothetical protein
LQNIMKPVCFINVGVFLASPFIFAFFITHLQWGLFGAAMANNVAYGITTLCMFVSAIWLHYRSSETHPNRLAWPGLSAEALKVRCLPCIRCMCCMRCIMIHDGSQAVELGPCACRLWLQICRLQLPEHSRIFATMSNICHHRVCGPLYMRFAMHRCS